MRGGREKKAFQSIVGSGGCCKLKTDKRLCHIEARQMRTTRYYAYQFPIRLLNVEKERQVFLQLVAIDDKNQV